MRFLKVALGLLVTLVVLAAPAAARRAGTPPSSSPATAITATSATLHATSLDSGTGTFRFDYGPTPAYGSSVTVANVGLGVDTPVTITNLGPGTTYYWTATKLPGYPVTPTPQRTFSTVANPPGSESADIAVTNAVVPTTATVGGTVTYTFVVSNAGAEARNARLVDPPVVGLTYLSASPTKGSCTIAGTVTCSFGNLVNRESVTVTLAATVTAAGSIANKVGAGADNPDPNVAGNNYATSTVTVNAPPAATTTAAPAAADLSVALSGSVTAGSPRQLVYEAKVANAGPAAARNVVLSTKLTTGRALLVSAPTCRATGHLVYKVGTIAAGASVTVRIVLRPGGKAVRFVNTASVSADETDPVQANNSTSTTTSVPDQR